MLFYLDTSSTTPVPIYNYLSLTLILWSKYYCDFYFINVDVEIYRDFSKFSK